MAVKREFGKTRRMRWNDLSWLRSNRPLLVAQVISVPLIIAWYLFIYFDTHNTFALVFLSLIPIFAVINVATINWKRGRLTNPDARRDSRTGVVVAPTAAQSSTPSTIRPMRWVGAANVPGSLGRMSASMPLGVLELVPGRITFRIRPAFLSSMFGAKALVAAPADVEAVFPARVRFGYRAIGIRPLGAPPYYFLCAGQRDSILSAVAAAGFPVQWDERKYSYG
jgi:hypothetical protein